MRRGVCAAHLRFLSTLTSLPRVIANRLSESIERLSRDRAVLIIAHRLENTVTADRILVLDEGRIVESGTHGVLLARGGLYAEMSALYHEERG